LKLHFNVLEEHFNSLSAHYKCISITIIVYYKAVLFSIQNGILKVQK